MGARCKNNKKRNKELVASVKAMIDEDAHIVLDLEETASALNISSGSASSILCYRLGFHKICVRWIPHVFMPLQRRDRVTHSAVLLKMYVKCDPGFSVIW